MNWRFSALTALGALVLAGLPAPAQTSTGADGAFSITSSDPKVVNGVYYFDPRDSKCNSGSCDADKDNIYHFTTFYIGPDVWVRLRAKNLYLPGPVVFLATGEVRIEGYLELNGDSGHPGQVDESVRVRAEPGPGGFPGGLGGKPGFGGMPGNGPGGGTQSATNKGHGCSASHISPAAQQQDCKAAVIYGNSLIQPLIGGSGGSGGGGSGSTHGGGGGAGGGAIRIRSATKISIPSVNGRAPGVYANGGWGAYGAYNGGGGSGGSIHLQAPVMDLLGNATLQVAGSSLNGGGTGTSASGRIRLDRDLQNGGASATVTPVAGPFTGIDVPLPTSQPKVVVTSIGGQSVPEKPGDGYTNPDVTLNAQSPVTVEIAAANIPLGTIVKLYITTDVGGTDAIADTTPLAGTLASSTATASVTLPQGVSRIFVRAVW